MKRFVFGFFFFFLIKNSHAQKVEGGLLLGFNSCQIDGDFVGGYDKLGLRAGVFAQTGFKTHYSFRLEMAYSNRGSRQTYKEFEPPTGLWDMVSLHYIELPFLFTYDIPYQKIKGLNANWLQNVYAVGGLTASYLIGQNIIALNGGAYGSNPFKDWEWGAQGGSGYKINKRLNAEVRFHYSVISISKGNNTLWFQPNRGFRNNLMTLQINYNFRS
ncbi:MAG: PorT family protein [Flavobacteriaceae bacterium]|nr:PorT family protein [Flavobacteriaceae bacterium]